MSYLDIYSRRINHNGNTEKDKIVNEGIRNFDEFLKDAPNKETIKVGNQFYEGVIQDVTFNDSNKDNKILLVSVNTPFNIGTVFDWGSEKWLITGVEKNVISTHLTFKITQTNNTLTFYKTQILRTLPCIIQTSGANYLGLDENKFITSPNGKYTCICPDLGYIKKTDMNLRFIINESAYKIGGINNLNNGLIVLELVDDKIIVDDRPDLGIANWYSNQIIEHPPQAEIVVTPAISTLTVAKSTVFEARFFNEGVEDLLIHFDWILINEDGSNNVYANIVPNNRTCTIIPINSPSVIGKVINLKVSLVENPTRFIIKQYKIVSLI